MRYHPQHDMGMFVAVGTATVSRDGSVLVADPGMGIVKGGWSCGGNPATRGTAHQCPTCKKCDGTSCVDDFDKNTQCCDEQFGKRPKYPIASLEACPGRVDRQGRRPSMADGCTALPGDGPIIAILDGSESCTAFAIGIFTPACNNHDICYDTCSSSSSKDSCDSTLLSGWENVCNNFQDDLCAINCHANATLFKLALKGAGFLGFYERAQRDVCQCCP